MSPITTTTAATEMSFYSNTALVGSGSKNPEKVATLFEAMFYRMLLKDAREASLAEGLFDSDQMDQVQQMHDDEMANYLAAGGQLGIKDLMLKQIKEQQERTVSVEEFTKNPQGLLKGHKATVKG